MRPRPVHTWKRRLTAAARIGDVHLPAGTNLLLLLGSANHDPSHVLVEWDMASPVERAFADCPDDVTVAGGKGAGLAGLSGAALPVPPGFVVTTAAFEAALTADNVLAPGFTLTAASRDLIEDADTYGVARGAIKRGLAPDDIVGTAVFLCSDASAMITGQTIVVDGGRQFL